MFANRFVDLRILWCYEQIERLTERGEAVACWDEKPNLQALERPRQPARPGQIERQEFEYTRHGTVNFGVALALGEGSITGRCLERNDSEHLCPALAELFESLQDALKVHLIWDEGPSHGSGYTKDFRRQHRGWVRVLPTPAHSSSDKSS